MRNRVRSAGRLGWGISLALWLWAPAVSAAIVTNGFVLKGDIVTMDSQLSVITNGQVVVIGEKIAAVLRAGEAMPAAVGPAPSLVIDTGGYIFPGLIDAHNHLEYNALPLWEVPKTYSNRYQWSGVKAYDVEITKPKSLLTDHEFMDQQTEVIKYAEVKAMLGGATSIQGSPNVLTTRLLVRNIEYNNFGADRIYTRTLSIGQPRFLKNEASALAELMDQGKVDAWVVHLAEGTDAKSRGEFADVKQLRLLRDVTVIIHGTALQAADFEEMAHVGAKLVWSPLSNLLLYGKTTDIPSALAAGLTLCLGVDWSPSGSKNLLGELKIAHEYDKAQWGHKLSDRDLAKMVTVNPAIALGLDDKIGRIKSGYYADVTVFKKNRPDPYRNLIEAVERDVELVMIGGAPCYGDLPLMRQLKGDDLELLTVQGVDKGLDVTDPQVPSGNEKFSTIESTLTKALLADPAYLHQHFGAGLNEEAFEILLDKEFPSLHAIVLDSILPDRRFFDALRASTNAHLPFDIEPYWSRATQPVTDGSEAALLAFVNDPRTNLDLLETGAGINGQAAKAIIQARNGPDNVPGTTDDTRFKSVIELDRVPHVGRSTLNLLRTYALSHAL